MADEQKPSGVPEGWEVIQGGKASAAPAAVLPDVSARAGVPAAGRGTQLDPDKSMRGLDAATTPLAHPTGIDAVDNFTSPLGLASLAAGGAGVVRAGVEGGAGMAAKSALAQASPLLKFEATRRALTAIGIPDVLATGAAVMVSGYKGGKAAEVEHVSAPGFPRTSTGPTPAPVAAAQTDLSRVPASSLTQEQIAERMAATNAGAVPETAAAAVPVPAGSRLADQRAAFEARAAARQAPAAAPAVEVPAAAPIASPAPASPAVSALPNQKALNELAIAARRAKTVLSPDEARALVKVVEAGQTPQSAVADLMQARLAADPASAFNARYGLTQPTEAQIRFPKGMRGKATGAQP